MPTAPAASGCPVKQRVRRSAGDDAQRPHDVVRFEKLLATHSNGGLTDLLRRRRRDVLGLGVDSAGRRRRELTSPLNRSRGACIAPVIRSGQSIVTLLLSSVDEMSCSVLHWLANQDEHDPFSFL